MRIPTIFALPFLALAVASACSSDPAASSPDAGAAPDGGSIVEPPKDANDAGSDAPIATCPRARKADDHARAVVVSHPFDAQGKKTNLFEVLELSAAGDLKKKGETFAMRTAFREIAFTP